MITTPRDCQESIGPDATQSFLEMLPTIQRIANYTFRQTHRAAREEFVAEVIANAFSAFQRLLERGNAELAYPTPLARFAVKQVHAGRHLGSKLNIHDVLSPYAQRRKTFSVQSLDQRSRRDQWQELIEDRRATPADIATIRVDFRDWLNRLKQFKRQVALRLAAGDTTSEAAQHFRLSRARISQLRQELEKDWNAFQGVLAAA
jgi:hypothetical protein